MLRSYRAHTRGAVYAPHGSRYIAAVCGSFQIVWWTVNTVSIGFAPGRGLMITIKLKLWVKSLPSLTGCATAATGAQNMAMAKHSARTCARNEYCANAPRKYVCDAKRDSDPSAAIGTR